MFLPNDYKVPDSGNYMKLKAGENTFRVLSSAITGFEYWTGESKPVRSKEQFKATPDIKLDKNGVASQIKHFWAFVVWNYASSKIQILEITQSSIQGAIKAIVDNKKWGDPKGYDITITRVGEGLDTEYSIMPNPHSTLDKETVGEFNIDLEALYDGSDPFSKEAMPENFLNDEINTDDIKLD